MAIFWYFHVYIYIYIYEAFLDVLWYFLLRNAYDTHPLYLNCPKGQSAKRGKHYQQTPHNFGKTTACKRTISKAWQALSTNTTQFYQNDCLQPPLSRHAHIVIIGALVYWCISSGLRSSFEKYHHLPSQLSNIEQETGKNLTLGQSKFCRPGGVHIKFV